MILTIASHSSVVNFEVGHVRRSTDAVEIQNAAGASH
jgi:hypothetical protein